MPEVLDYSAGWPRNIAPYVGTVRYVGTPGRSKNLTLAEAVAREADGTPQAFVYESTAGWMLVGWAAGVGAATAARNDLHDLGYPDYRAIYLACDVDISTAGQLAAVDACLDGAASVLGRSKVGIYGEADVIDHCMGNGKAAYGWQTRAWSGGRVSGRACLLQQVGYVSVDGVQCDRNTILKDDWGQWPVEDDVSYDDAVKALRDVLHLPATGLTPAQGQTHNGNLAAILVGASQAEYTRDAAEARTLAALAAQVDPAAFADAVVAKLPAGISGGLTEDQVREAAGDALRDVLGGLNDPPPTAP
jgi:hypothetical protein